MTIARLAAFLLVPFLLLSCKSTTPTAKEVNGNVDNLPSGEIRYTLIDLYAHYSVKVTITPANDITVEESKGQGPEDQRRILSAITPDERAALNNAFSGWNKLNQFYATDVASLVTINYGGHEVNTSNLSAVPATFKNAKTVIDRIMVSLMQAANEKTAQEKAATAPATAPTTAN